MKDDFLELVEDEQELFRLAQEFSTKVTSLATQLGCEPEIIEQSPELIEDAYWMLSYQTLIDAQYEWYYKAYAPLDTPASMAPPGDHTTSIQTYFENCVDYLFGWLMSPGDEQGIRQQIAYSEHQ